MGKDAYYFSHDSNARNDQKMLQLRAVYGAEGYGWFWILIEMMRDANAYRLHYDGRYSFTAIAKELGCTDDEAKKFVDDCIDEFSLFTKIDGSFYSESLLRRMGQVEARREKARESAKVRWERNANALQTQSERNAIKGKEKKGKEKKSITPASAGDTADLSPAEPWKAEFEQFWNAYAKKTGRPACETKFRKLRAEDRALILERVPAYVASTPEVKYRKNPLTYLNGRHWEDEIPSPTPQPGNIPEPVQETPEQMYARLKMVY